MPFAKFTHPTLTKVLRKRKPSLGTSVPWFYSRQCRNKNKMQFSTLVILVLHYYMKMRLTASNGSPPLFPPLLFKVLLSSSKRTCPSFQNDFLCTLTSLRIRDTHKVNARFHILNIDEHTIGIVITVCFQNALSHRIEKRYLFHVFTYYGKLPKGRIGNHRKNLSFIGTFNDFVIIFIW